MHNLPLIPAIFAQFYAALRPRRNAPSPETDTWRPARQPRAPGWGKARRRRYGRL